MAARHAAQRSFLKGPAAQSLAAAWAFGRSEAELADNRVIHTVAPVVTPLALAVFPVRAPAPGARTLRRQAARPGATAGSAHSIARYAAFSRFAPGSWAPHMDHRLSEAPPRLWPASRGVWRRAAGPRPRRAWSRAALAPLRRQAGGVARAALVAAPRRAGAVQNANSSLAFDDNSAALGDSSCAVACSPWSPVITATVEALSGLTLPSGGCTAAIVSETRCKESLRDRSRRLGVIAVAMKTAATRRRSRGGRR